MTRRRQGWTAATVFVVAAIAFSVLAVAVASRSGPLGPDSRLLHDVVDWRSGALTTLAKVVTTFGTDFLVYPLLIVVAVVCARRANQPRIIVLALAVLISGQIVRTSINRTIARARPPVGLHLMSASGYAFPSGHTSNATMTYGLIALLLSLSFPRLRWVFVLGAVILAIGVGFSRVYLAVHWATDVAGGWLFGIAWLALAGWLVAVAPTLPRRRGRS